MGAEQVLRAARRRRAGVAAAVALGALGALAWLAGDASAAPWRGRGLPTATSLDHATRGERIAIVDLGPDPADGAVRGGLAAAVTAAGLTPLTDDGLDDALAGIARDRDERAIAASLEEASRAYGELDCAGALNATDELVRRGAARQAAGLAVPALGRALAYQLSCADRAGDVDRATRAAARLRAVGGAPTLDAALWARYPEIDVGSNREIAQVQIEAELAGAALWIDHQRVGVTPATVYLPVGEHVIAAAAGSRRGAVVVTIGPRPTPVTLELPEQGGRWDELAARIAGWRGHPPTAAALAGLIDQLEVRIVLVRQGDQLDAWGRTGKGQPPIRLGADLALRAADPAAVVALLRDRIGAWNAHAPDPDQPLLVEEARAAGAPADPPTRWYVYASLAGALVLGGVALYAHDSAHDTQRVEVHLP